MCVSGGDRRLVFMGLAVVDHDDHGLPRGSRRGKARHGTPAIFNTGRGSRLPNDAVTRLPKAHGILSVGRTHRSMATRLIGGCSKIREAKK